MKKISMLALCIVCMCGCTIKGSEPTSTKYPTTTYITEDMREHSQKGTFEPLTTVSLEPENLLNLASDVAIVKVISVDRADMDFSGFFPTTYGTMMVVLPLVGNLEKQEVIDFVKPGGLVSIAEYERVDDPNAIAKRDYLRKNYGIEVDKEKNYYDILLGNDVVIEEGKTYLAYLDYHEKQNVYEVVGLGNGFREIDVPKEDVIDPEAPIDIEGLHLLNNTTGEWESLADYINRYLPN